MISSEYFTLWPLILSNILVKIIYGRAYSCVGSVFLVYIFLKQTNQATILKGYLEWHWCYIQMSNIITLNGRFRSGVNWTILNKFILLIRHLEITRADTRCFRITGVHDNNSAPHVWSLEFVNWRVCQKTQGFAEV